MMTTEETQMIAEMIASGDLLEEGEEYTRCPNCGDGMYLASTGGCAYCGWVA